MAKAPQRLPQLLSREEGARLIDSARTLRGRTLLMTTYAAGLRVSDVCALQVGDMESAADRLCLKVCQGKGGKDPYTLLPPRLLAALGTYWRDTRPRRVHQPGRYRPDGNPDRPADLLRCAQRDVPRQARLVVGQGQGLASDRRLSHGHPRRPRRDL
ncbi:tyrosine-type recombinase/integrase [Candidatus Accumulibacter phosphatis]|uniref:tyrosine-type recombinase/integrase n=1 Tax=Candidatus Accumulibacter phosphatis TaxID=327160 RepID=UPI0039B89660